MGLDVSLHRFENFDNAQALMDEYNEKSDKLWDKEIKKLKKEKYGDLTEDQKEIIREKDHKIALGLGLDKYGQLENEDETINIDSKKHPKNYWKIGYFRSSYNSGGFNNMSYKLMSIKLYDIFSPPDGEYHFRPDWEEAKKIVEDAIYQLKKIIKTSGAFRAIEFDTQSFAKDKTPSKATEALEIFNEERKSYLTRKLKNPKISFASYSNGYGEFYMKEPLKIFGFIKGFKQFSFSGEKEPQIYAIINDVEEYDYLIECLEIVVETCEYVLKQKDSDKYHLGWSA